MEKTKETLYDDPHYPNLGVTIKPKKRTFKEVMDLIKQFPVKTAREIKRYTEWKRQ